MIYSQEVSIIAAFLAGLMSFLSPCVLPLATGQIMYITGTLVEGELKSRKRFALKQTIGFIIGFTIVFSLLGISAGALGRVLIIYKGVFLKLSGIFIVIMGLNILGVFKFRLGGKRIKRPQGINSWWGALFMGIAFGIGWTPCVGPILGAILFYAGSQGTVAKGAYLLVIYSMGLSIPFLITALLIDRISAVWNKVSGYTQLLMKLSGVLIIILGIMIFLDKVYIFSKFGY